MGAISWDLLTNTVGRGLPFQFTVDPETNPVPLTVRKGVVAAAPGAIASGTRGWLMNGTEFCAMTICADTNRATRLNTRTAKGTVRVMDASLRESCRARRLGRSTCGGLVSRPADA